MVLFNAEECEFIKSFYYKEIENYSAAAAGFSKGQVKFSNSSCKYVDSIDAELLSFIVERTANLGVKSLDGVKIIRYEEGNFLGRHADFSKYGANLLFKTYMIQLSKHDDYTGGDLIVENKIMSRVQGSCITISSTDLHEVTKILSGERFSLVLFLTEKNLNLTKSLL